jgi:hypothetical protein
MSSRAKANARNKKSGRRDAVLYTLAAVLLIVAGVVLFARRASASEHPKPRANAEHMHTESPDRYGAYPEAKEVYGMSAHIKSTLDGLFCYCYCKGGGHYSLLDCFKDDHGAGCDVCLGEARLAYDMIQKGATLAEIRAAIDAQFGQS